jgi:hypothetical protein
LYLSIDAFKYLVIETQGFALIVPHFVQSSLVDADRVAQGKSALVGGHAFANFTLADEFP